MFNKKFMVFLGVLLGLMLCVTPAINIYNDACRIAPLKAQLNSELDILKPLDQIKQAQADLSAKLATASKSLYSAESIYQFYRSFENRLATTGFVFKSLDIQPIYAKDGSAKYFTAAINFSGTNPISFFKMMRTMVPPLYVTNFTYGLTGDMTATVKGYTSDSADAFALTTSLYNSKPYQVSQYFGMIDDPSLLPSNNQYTIIHSQNTNYVVRVVNTDLDKAAATARANELVTTSGGIYIVTEMEKQP